MAVKKQKIARGYSSCNKVELIRGGKEYFELILSLINKAVESIHLQVYIYEEDATGQLVADALKAAAKRNVQVYLLVDGYASQALSKDFIQSLKNAGVHFRFFEPLLKSSHFYFGRRMHHKILVVDGKFAVTGSKNISNRYNDMPHAPSWLDFTLYMEGKVARDLCIVCTKTWNGFNMGKRAPRCETHSFDIQGEALTHLRVRRNDWVRRRNQIALTYKEMLRHANSHITILCSYFLPGKTVRNLLKRAARRGVTIRVIVAGKSDVVLSKNAERWLYDWLLRNKIEVYEYETSVLHAKTATCDSKWLTIGSFNINNISTYASIELNVDVRNEAFTKKVEHTLDKIIKEECIQVTDETLARTTNIFKQFARWASYQAIRFMFYAVTFYYRQD